MIEKSFERALKEKLGGKWKIYYNEFGSLCIGEKVVEKFIGISFNELYVKATICEEKIYTHDIEFANMLEKLDPNLKIILN